MKSEKRRYKIKGFRDDGIKIRVLLEPADLVKPKQKMGMTDIMTNPLGAARQMMNQQMQQIIHDSFSVSKEEYQKQRYMIGEIVIVTLQRE